MQPILRREKRPYYPGGHRCINKIIIDIMEIVLCISPQVYASVVSILRSLARGVTPVLAIQRCGNNLPYRGTALCSVQDKDSQMSIYYNSIFYNVFQ